MAPEIFTSKSYNEKVDIWSLGVVFYTMLCGYRPFEGETADEIFYEAQKGNFNLTGKAWAKISYDAKDFVSKMLNVNPKERISAK